MILMVFVIAFCFFSLSWSHSPILLNRLNSWNAQFVFVFYQNKKAMLFASDNLLLFRNYLLSVQAVKEINLNFDSNMDGFLSQRRINSHIKMSVMWANRWENIRYTYIVRIGNQHRWADMQQSRIYDNERISVSLRLPSTFTYFYHCHQT